jgi:hypothetical protein
MAPSSSRGSAPRLWLAVHTAEGILKATDLRAFFDRSTNSSAHACADDGVLLDNLVSYDRAAWTLRSGNEESDNLELCGFAAWSRETWLQHDGMLTNAATWLRRRSQATGIPLVKLSAADVAANRRGVIGHIDYTNGKHDGTHWDPGPGFPWDIVIARARGESARPSTPAEIAHREDRYMLAPAAADDFITVPCNGKSRIYIGTGYGRSVTVIQANKIGETIRNGTGGNYLGTFSGVIDADRPGPIELGRTDIVAVVVRYSADHPFTIWCDN